jgi:hypothetical protein
VPRAGMPLKHRARGRWPECGSSLAWAPSQRPRLRAVTAQLCGSQTLPRLRSRRCGRRMQPAQLGLGASPAATRLRLSASGRAVNSPCRQRRKRRRTPSLRDSHPWRGSGGGRQFPNDPADQTVPRAMSDAGQCPTPPARRESGRHPQGGGAGGPTTPGDLAARRVGPPGSPGAEAGRPARLARGPAQRDSPSPRIQAVRCASYFADGLSAQGAK